MFPRSSARYFAHSSQYDNYLGQAGVVRSKKMLAWCRNLLNWSWSRLPTALTLGLLGGLAFWGWNNDWKVPGASREVASEADSPATAIKVSSESTGTGSSASALQRLDFPSVEAVRKSGIEVARVEVHTTRG
jgi:hypothetical protein